MSFALVLGFMATRLMFLPDGPWEQDEAIFASAVVDYDLVHHRPHPPGFPGWIGLGRLLAPLTGDPLLALQLVSSAASVILFVVLAAMLASLVSAPLALAVALATSFLPGVWFHAPRAFSTTPALASMTLALWCWWPKKPRLPRLALGWVLLGLGLLIRPHLLPIAGLLGICGLHRRRYEPATAVALAYVGLAVVLIGFVPVIADTGGVEKTLDLTLAHLRKAAGHGFPTTFSEFGVVRAFGGVAAAAAWIGAGIAGLLYLQRRARYQLWALALVLVTLVLIAGVHPPSHPRYAVPLMFVTAPGVALLLQRLINIRPGTRWMVWGIPALVCVLGLTSAILTAPAMLALRVEAITPVQALRELAKKPDHRVVVTTAGVTPYARLSHLTGALRSPVYSYKSIVRDHKPQYIPGDRTVSLLALRPQGLPGATTRHSKVTGYPLAAWPLSQQRYQVVHRIDNPVFLGDGVYTPEINGRAEPYSWLAKSSRLIIPGVGETVELVLEVDKRRAPLVFKASIAKEIRLRQRLDAGHHRISIPSDNCSSPCIINIQFDKALKAPNEGRRLSARLYGAWVTGPGRVAYAQRWNPGQPLLTMARGVVIERGVHGPETFTAQNQPGSWLDDHAKVNFPAVPGTLHLTLAVPPPRDQTVTLETSGHRQTIDATGEPTSFSIEVDAPDGQDFLRVTSHALIPADSDPKSRDYRRLGALLFDVLLEPASEESM